MKQETRGGVKVHLHQKLLPSLTKPFQIHFQFICQSRTRMSEFVIVIQGAPCSTWQADEKAAECLREADRSVERSRTYASVTPVFLLSPLPFVDIQLTFLTRLQSSKNVPSGHSRVPSQFLPSCPLPWLSKNIMLLWSTKEYSYCVSSIQNISAYLIDIY